MDFLILNLFADMITSDDEFFYGSDDSIRTIFLPINSFNRNGNFSVSFVAAKQHIVFFGRINVVIRQRFFKTAHSFIYRRETI